MITYKYCHTPMINVMSFSKDKHEKFLNVQNATQNQNIRKYKMMNWILEKY